MVPDTPSFLIKDLLTAEKSGQTFVQKGINFVNVYLHGTCISTESTSSTGKFESFKIEDGTGVIPCLFERKKESFVEENPNKQELGKIKNPHLLQTALFTIQIHNNIKQRYNQDVKVGDSMFIFGKLREKNGKRYIFVDKTEKMTNLKQKVEYFEQLFLLYDKVYLMDQ